MCRMSDSHETECRTDRCTCRMYLDGEKERRKNGSEGPEKWSSRDRERRKEIQTAVTLSLGRQRRRRCDL